MPPPSANPYILNGKNANPFLFVEQIHLRKVPVCSNMFLKINIWPWWSLKGRDYCTFIICMIINSTVCDNYLSYLQWIITI